MDRNPQGDANVEHSETSRLVIDIHIKYSICIATYVCEQTFIAVFQPSYLIRLLIRF